MSGKIIKAGSKFCFETIEGTVDLETKLDITLSRDPFHHDQLRNEAVRLDWSHEIEISSKNPEILESFFEFNRLNFRETRDGLFFVFRQKNPFLDSPEYRLIPC